MNSLKIIFLVGILTVAFGSFAQPVESGIVFQEIPFQEVFLKSKELNKPIFMYFHFKGCGACTKMEREVFSDGKVANFYNENFLCFEVDTREGVGIEINKIYNVQLQPTFLFLNSENHILHKLVGIFTVEEFLREGEAVFSPIGTLDYYKNKYAEGNRNPEFLFEFVYKLRDAGELDSVVVNEYLSTQNFKDLSLEKNVRFIFEFAVHGFDAFIDLESPAYEFMLNDIDRFSEYFERDQVITRIFWGAYQTAYQVTLTKNERRFFKALDVIKRFENHGDFYFKEIDGRLTGIIQGKFFSLTVQMEYYEKNNNLEQYYHFRDEYVKRIWNDWDLLNALAWNYYEQNKELEKAKKWAKRSIKLQSDYANNDTYAAILFKLGKTKRAKKFAKKALNIGKTRGKDYSSTELLLIEINDRLKRK